MEMCEIESCIQGYESIWSPSAGEELDCGCEPTNTKDPYAVAVLRRSNVVGHIPRKISATCSLFLRRKGTIPCRIQRLSDDLPQRGLEVPCMLISCGEPKDVAKLVAPVSVKQTTARSRE